MDASLQTYGESLSFWKTTPYIHHKMKTDAKSIDSCLDDLEETEPKERTCLMCAESFESTWAGERICTRCKSRVGWRRGG
ncbi:MAG: hypothetical protein J4G10_04400 [Alphaproteobacteria bacterium]|nr:hypothetical protein [Alphaproteobacteria bacterium]